jgi:xanthosine utilization system XapX-like protein
MDTMKVMPRPAIIALAAALVLTGVVVYAIRVSSGAPVANSLVSALGIVLGVSIPLALHQWAARRRITHANT